MMANLKTVKKWEELYKCELEKKVVKGKVVKLKCKVCIEFESRITSIKGFSRGWITGTDSVKKDSLFKHTSGDPHLYVKDLQKKKSLGASDFNRVVLSSTPIGRGLTKMTEEDKEILNSRFNTAYYLEKNERPYSDFPDLIALQEKNGVKQSSRYCNERAGANFLDTVGETIRESFVNDLRQANYYSILMDGSTDSSIIEQELVYVLFLNKEGRAVVEFFSIESVKNANADGLKAAIKESFERVGIVDFAQKLHGLNVDGASVNTGIHCGLEAKLKESAPWLTVIHCFNHRLELAVKDSFKGTFFDEIDHMLLKLYYLYKKSPKRLRELHMFGDIYDKVVPKPSKASGTRWIAHKVRAMEIVLSNYGVFITHLESLSQTDSQALKRAELVGFSKRWVQAKYPIHLAIYLDILQPIKVLSLSMKKEIHDPVSQLKKIREFRWSMTKLHALIEGCLDENATRLTNFTKLLY